MPISKPINGTVGVERCCPSCFASDAARNFVESRGTPGRCHFCENDGSHTIQPGLLHDLFWPLISLFEVPPQFNGHCLTECELGETNLAEQLIDSSFDVLSSHLSVEKQCELLDHIRKIEAYPDHLSSGPWRHCLDYYWDYRNLFAWDVFSTHLKSDGKSALAPEAADFAEKPQVWLLEAILKYGKTECIEPADKKIFYRARRGGDLDQEKHLVPWPKEKMDAPPPHKATIGRANPRGVAFLYASTNDKTAVAEVRPEIGSFVTVRPVAAKQPLKLVDLREELVIEDPIGDKELHERVAAYAMLNSLRTDLSKPVQRAKSDVEYLPSQFLTEVIRGGAYDGIMFPSSQSASGENIVIFVPAKCEVCDPPELREV
jgi:hypothetical protein